jgi:hypothetical protein
MQKVAISHPNAIRTRIRLMWQFDQRATIRAIIVNDTNRQVRITPLVFEHVPFNAKKDLAALRPSNRDACFGIAQTGTHFAHNKNCHFASIRLKAAWVPSRSAFQPTRPQPVYRPKIGRWQRIPVAANKNLIYYPSAMKGYQ